MSTLSKSSVYASRHFSRAIASSGGVGFTSIFQAPANGISLINGMIFHDTLDRTDYSFILTSTTTGTPRNASEARIFYPTMAGAYKIGRGTGTGTELIYTQDASSDIGTQITRSTAGYLYLVNYPVQTSWYFAWELSGAVGAANIGYDITVTDITYT